MFYKTYSVWALFKMLTQLEETIFLQKKRLYEPCLTPQSEFSRVTKKIIFCYSNTSGHHSKMSKKLFHKILVKISIIFWTRGHNGHLISGRCIFWTISKTKWMKTNRKLWFLQHPDYIQCTMDSSKISKFWPKFSKYFWMKLTESKSTRKNIFLFFKSSV